MKKIIIFTLLLLLTTLPSTAKGIKTHMDGMRQHGGARSAIPSVMVDQESAYVTVEISRYSGEYAIYISDEYGVPSSNTDTYIHANFGWSGREDGYYMVDRNTTNLDFETSNNGHYNQDLKLYPNVRKK